MSSVSSRTMLFYILAAISLVLLILSSSGQLSPAEGLLGSGFRPLLSASSGLGRQLTNGLDAARDLTTLRARNEQLQSAVNTLTIDNLRLNEVAGENERLRRLLRFRQLNPTYDVRGGQVIALGTSQGASNYLRTITIDLGAEHGIAPDMPVVTEDGLVGKIYRVGPTSSTVLLINDLSSGVPAMIKRSREVGVVNGQSGGYPIMGYLHPDADVIPGDVVITSGLGGTLPKNLVIGQVIKVNKRDFDMFQEAVVRATVDFNRLEVVLVITNFKPLPGQPEEPEGVG